MGKPKGVTPSASGIDVNVMGCCETHVWEASHPLYAMRGCEIPAETKGGVAKRCISGVKQVYYLVN